MVEQVIIEVGRQGANTPLGQLLSSFDALATSAGDMFYTSAPGVAARFTTAGFGRAVLSLGNEAALWAYAGGDARARAAIWPIPQTLVIFGSSNAAGVGATGYTADPVGPAWTEPANSWAGRLRSALTGWNVFNRSISGNGTANLISRFWTDVAPHRPSHVIICAALHNDGYNSQTFVKNTQRLIELCRMIGAVPIIRGPSSYNSATSANLSAMLDTRSALDLLGEWQIDAFTTLTDPTTGYFISGSSFHTGDGLHCNDAGYLANFSAIDLGMFYGGSRGPAHTKPRGAWLQDVSAVNGMVQVDTSSGLRKGLRSFSIRVRAKNAGAGISARALLSMFVSGDSNAPLRVRNPSDVWGLTQGDGTAGVGGAVASTDGQVRDHVVTYNRETNTAAYFIDGVSQGSFNPAGTIGDVTRFMWSGRENGSPAGGFVLEDCQLWGVPLDATTIADMARTGYRPAYGLLYDAVQSGTPRGSGTGGIAPNLVQNGVQGATLDLITPAAPLTRAFALNPVTLQNSWVTRTGAAYAPAGYVVSDSGVVTLQGHIAGGTTTAATLLFTLPIGARPRYLHMFPVLLNGSPGGSIQVWPDGSVTAASTLNATGTCFDGASFKAA